MWKQLSWLEKNEHFNKTNKGLKSQCQWSVYCGTLKNIIVSRRKLFALVASPEWFFMLLYWNIIYCCNKLVAVLPWFLPVWYILNVNYLKAKITSLSQQRATKLFCSYPKSKWANRKRMNIDQNKKPKQTKTNHNSSSAFDRLVINYWVSTTLWLAIGFTMVH